MTTQREQQWAVGGLAIIAIIAALVVFVVSSAVADSGSRSEHSPSGGYRTDQSWFLFDGDGATCHVESWSDNPNRSLHDNFLVTVDTNGTTTHLAVERTTGTTDRGLWDSTETGEVYLQLKLGDDQRSSASYHAEWTCEETPSTSTSTSSTSTTEEPPPSSSTLPPDSTTTSAPPGSSSTTTTLVQICAVSDCNVVDPPTTETTTTTSGSPTTTTVTRPPSSTTLPPIPSAVPTGEG